MDNYVSRENAEMTRKAETTKADLNRTQSECVYRDQGPHDSHGDNSEYPQKRRNGSFPSGSTPTSQCIRKNRCETLPGSL